MERKIDIQVKEFKKGFDLGKEVIFYILTVSSRGTSWTLEKRYSEIEKLHSELLLHHPSLPQFPRKSLFSIKKLEDIESRMRQLDYFFSELSTRADIMKNHQVLAFLHVSEKLGIRGEDELVFAFDFENPALGYRDFVYLPQKRVFATIACDMNPVSRVDSYFTNLKMPWDSGNKDIIFSIGLFEVNLVRGDKDLKFAPLFNVSFNTQAICMDYSEVLDMFAVGFDDGSVRIYKVNRNSRPHYDVVFDDKVHSKRVMKLAFDGQRVALYSVGEDAAVQVIDIARRRVEGSYLISSHDAKETLQPCFRQLCQETYR